MASHPGSFAFSDGGEAHTLTRGCIGLLPKTLVTHPVFTVAVGTSRGTTIPVENRFGLGKESLREPGGQPVITKMVPEQLHKIAKITGGDFFTAKFDDTRILSERLAQTIEDRAPLPPRLKLIKNSHPFLFTLALLLLACELFFGRWEYAIRSIVLALFLFVPHQVHADEANDKTERTPYHVYNDGLEQLSQGNLPKAAELFQESAATKDKALKKQSLYNLGNTLLKMMNPSQAIEVYQQAYDIDSGDKSLNADANHRISDNIVLATRMEEKLKKQSKEQNEGQGQGDKKDQANDPKGPKKDYESESFTDAQRERILNLVSAEEQATIQRLMDQRKKPNSSESGKPW